MSRRYAEALVTSPSTVAKSRISFDFCHRILPYFAKDNFSPENDKILLRTPTSVADTSGIFFYAIVGREGVIDTAMTNAETGYIQISISFGQGLEDVMVY